MGAGTARYADAGTDRLAAALPEGAAWRDVRVRYASRCFSKFRVLPEAVEALGADFQGMLVHSKP
jgi:hypothetical protein